MLCCLIENGDALIESTISNCKFGMITCDNISYYSYVFNTSTRETDLILHIFPINPPNLRTRTPFIFSNINESMGLISLLLLVMRKEGHFTSVF